MTMYARVVTAIIAPEHLEEGIQIYRDVIAPAAQQQRGFHHGHLLVDYGTGKFISTSVWETQADLQATGEQSTYLQEQLAKLANLFMAPAMVDHYEVAVDVGP